jgi:GT2 family glycosyltransferase
MFWSLSFATSASTWRRIGGFCEDYTGYGGEDTDFGQLARQAGVELCWVGDAWAFHQHHPKRSPPTEHLDDILRNAELFHRRWGWWPMEGWLAEFADAGLVRFDGERLRRQVAQT